VSDLETIQEETRAPRESPALHPSLSPSLFPAPPTGYLPKLITIGVFGFDEAGFFTALQKAGVDTFCDIRARRGVRGREFAFVNSRRLQARLSELNIRYFHFEELAPSQSVRQRQAAADKLQRTAKRQRAELSDAFIAGYREECLEQFDSRRFIEQLGPEARVVALFCVERTPAACHRSLVAGRLQHDLRLEVVHLTPDEVVPMKS
jgi:uncharacterized protein (DUF488 family)